MKILLVDDERRASEALDEFLNDQHDISICENGNQAYEFLKKNQVDLVITDHQMPEKTGLELIKVGKKEFPDTFFIMLTAHSSLDHAIQALRSGADDYLMKPVDFTELEMRVQRIDQLISWQANQKLQAQNPKAMDRIIGESSPIKALKEFITKVSEPKTPVLITGASGSGKELVAKAIHESSPRNKHPFIAINCATLNEQLLESELFGHEKGAFTGATASKPGKFELAREGTLFLDEIGELATSLQAKLLRVLQEKEFFRVGGTRLIQSRCRIVAATHRPLEDMVKSGEFREDLFFRLNVLHCQTPALNDRKEDIPLLVESFWKDLCQQMNCTIKLDPTLVEELKNRDYVGNVRELKNTLERLIVLNRDQSTLSATVLVMKPSRSPQSEQTFDDSQGLNEILEQLEKSIVEKAFLENEGNQIKTAKALQITRGALQYKLKRFEISGKKSA